ncbi:hypothetical protein N8072_00670 [bacterium]|nr:hypothetical protein [bacterium]
MERSQMNSEQKWAILLEFGDDDHIYVTEDTDKCWDLKVKVFANVNDALANAIVWKNAVVVPFDQ